jgi:hypothetical protein
MMCMDNAWILDLEQLPPQAVKHHECHGNANA